MNTYASLMECFLAMLLRPQDGYVTVYPPTLIQAIERFREALEDEQPSLERHIDRLLDHLWQCTWLPSGNSHVTDPTERFIMLKTLRPDGSFIKPELVTPMLAKMKFLIRVYLLRCMTDSGSRKRSLDQLKPWMHEKEECTFNTICDLQHQATAIAMATQKTPNIFWQE